MTAASDADILKLRVIDSAIEKIHRQYRINTWLHPNVMNAMSVSNADVIEIRGKKRATARCFSFNDVKLKECLQVLPAEEAEAINLDMDYGSRQDIIMMNPLVRNNAGVSIGDLVHVRKANALPAKYVVEAPLTEVTGGGRLQYIDTEGIGGIPVVRGNDTMVQSFGEEGILYRVIETNPSTDDDKTVVRIEESTKYLTLDKVMQVPIPEPNNLPREWYRRDSYRIKCTTGGGYQAMNEDKGSLQLTLNLTYRNSDYYELIRPVDRFKIDYEDQRKLIHLCQAAAKEIVRNANEKLKNRPVPDYDNSVGGMSRFAALFDFYDLELMKVKHDIVRRWNEIIDNF